jgi:hypothetical protein
MMIDQYKVVRSLSELRGKMIAKYTDEDREALARDLAGTASPLGHAIGALFEDFPISTVLKKKTKMSVEERVGLFSQALLLEMVTSVFRAMENYYPGISDQEMFRCAAQNLKAFVSAGQGPLDDFLDDFFVDPF